MNTEGTWKFEREASHATYNGGYRNNECGSCDNDEREAFHHGMDTVYNILDAAYPHPHLCCKAEAMFVLLQECNNHLRKGDMATKKEEFEILGKLNTLLSQLLA